MTRSFSTQRTPSGTQPASSAARKASSGTRRALYEGVAGKLVLAAAPLLAFLALLLVHRWLFA